MIWAADPSLDADEVQEILFDTAHSSPDDEVNRYVNALGAVQTADPDWFAERLSNYRTLFIGAHATVTYSDKAIGTNHVLPTGRAARYTGGLWVGKFLKTVTTQRVDARGSMAVAEHAAAVADAELMYGHAISARLRTNPEYFWDAMPEIPAP